MTGLINTLAAIWDWLVFVKKQAQGFFGPWWTKLLTLLGFIVGTLLGAIDIINDGLQSLVSKLNGVQGITVPEFPTALTNLVEFANTILPLSEAWQFMKAAIALHALCAVIAVFFWVKRSLWK